MVVTIETTAPKRRSRKTPFWSTLDTLIFLLFSNLCCLGSCAAVATLKQMLANNCYETFDRSVFFDLGPRTNGSLVNFRRKPFQSMQKTTEDVDNGHSKEWQSFDVDLQCNTFKIRFCHFWTVYTQANGGAGAIAPEHAAAIDFFFWSEKKGVRPHPPNPPWLRAWQRAHKYYSLTKNQKRTTFSSTSSDRQRARIKRKNVCKSKAWLTRWRELESTYCVTIISARNTGTWAFFFERRFQPLSVGGFFSNQRESISRCPKSPFPSKTQNRQIARTSPLRCLTHTCFSCN